MTGAGKLNDAAPLFASGDGIPRAGVLLAIPLIVTSGVFDAGRETYGHIGPAFYGLRTILMTLLILALLRIKRPENIKEHSPLELGRVLGLDRAPEVKTIRRKLDRLVKNDLSETFLQKLVERRVKSHNEALGFLYVDGHVRVYSGKADFRTPDTLPLLRGRIDSRNGVTEAQCSTRETSIGRIENATQFGDSKTTMRTALWRQSDAQLVLCHV